MTRKLTILFFLLVLVSAWASSPDFIDDVYFWETTSSEQTIYREATETLPRVNEPQNTVQVIFIEDSLTQDSDTIVKAVIRR